MAAAVFIPSSNFESDPGHALAGLTDSKQLSPDRRAHFYNTSNDIPFIALDPIGVTKDNIADTVIADGFRTWEEICVGDFEALCPGEDAMT